MPKTNLKPNEMLMLEFEPGRLNPRVVFEVRADSPVTTYLVDDMGKEDYMGGHTPPYYAGFRDRCNHQAEIALPNFSRYHLLIVNDSGDNFVKIEYNINDVH